MSGRNVSGLLADANLAGHFHYVVQLIGKLGLAGIFSELSVGFLTIDDLNLSPDIDDRSLWNFCQRGGWVLLTENRNAAGSDSLQTTLSDSWRPGDLPVITLAKKIEFEHSAEYRHRVATDVVELLFGIAHGEYLDDSRIYVPRG